MFMFRKQFILNNNLFILNNEYMYYGSDCACHKN